MNNYAKIGAGFYILWGILHVFGGISMLIYAYSGINEFIINLTSNENIKNLIIEDKFIEIALTQNLAFHSFNLIWFGLTSIIIAILLNYKNNKYGFWFNLIICGFSDIGLFIFMVIPGVIPIENAWMGPLLFLLAFLYSLKGIKNN